MATNNSRNPLSRNAVRQNQYPNTLEATYSRQFASHAFMRLEEAFKTVSFDLRSADVQENRQSFERLKEETERLLNSGAADRERLVDEFNQVCQPVWSAEKKKFAVMARVNRQGNIEIIFVDT
jgi:hypothetical protein